MNPDPVTPSLVSPPTPTDPVTPNPDTSLVNGAPNPSDPPAGDPPADPPVQKTAEEIAAETKAAEDAALAAAPVTVEDITLPEGFTASDEIMKEFVDVVNNSELSAKDRATALIDLQAKAMTAASEASSAAWTEMQEQWRNEVKADPIVGGDKLQPTLNSINKLVTEHGDEKLIEALAVTGAGNSLPVIKFLHTISNLLTEGGYQSGQPSGQEKSAAQRLYPSMPN